MCVSIFNTYTNLEQLPCHLKKGPLKMLTLDPFLSFFFLSFIEVKLTNDKLHIFKMHNLMSYETCIYL